MSNLAAIGLYTEPTSAGVAAVFTKLLRSGRIGPNETTVLLLTGSGTKATQRVGELLEKRDQ